MQTMYYIGLDIHKRTISCCVKDGSGTIHAEGTIPATRFEPGPLDEDTAAAADGGDGSHSFHRMGYLQPHAAAVKVAHPRGGAFEGGLHEKSLAKLSRGKLNL